MQSLQKDGEESLNEMDGRTQRRLAAESARCADNNEHVMELHVFFVWCFDVLRPILHHYQLMDSLGINY